MNKLNDPLIEPAATFGWRPTNAPPASSRTDDIWFIDADRGWAVNSNGHILQTVDGGQNWTRQFSAGNGVYLRCVGFADERLGWVGTLTQSRRLFHTNNGGTTWNQVNNLPSEAPPAICGLSVVSQQVVYGSGTNFPDRQPGIIKTIDGGATWTARNMSDHATLLVDIFFQDEQRGWVVGGKADVLNPDRDDVIPVVLFTADGGATWENRLAGMEAFFPKGEWGWKIQFINDLIGYVSLENLDDGAILKTRDGGATWERIPVNDPQNNANLEGIGFIDESLGWVGGWGDRDFLGGFTSGTTDGGHTWLNANQVGNRLNRFRFIREPELVGYASGRTVYKYSAAATPFAGLTRAVEEIDDMITSPFPVRFAIAGQSQAVRVDVWDRFGDHQITLHGDSDRKGENPDIVWSGETESGKNAKQGLYIYRVTTDRSTESFVLRIEN